MMSIQCRELEGLYKLDGLDRLEKLEERLIKQWDKKLNCPKLLAGFGQN